MSLHPEFELSDEGDNYVYRASFPTGLRPEIFTVKRRLGRKLRVRCELPVFAGPSFFKDVWVPFGVNMDGIRTYYGANKLTLILPKLTVTAVLRRRGRGPMWGSIVVGQEEVVRDDEELQSNETVGTARKEKQLEKMLRKEMEEDNKLKEKQAEKMLRKRIEDDKKLKEEQAEEMFRKKRMEDDKKLEEKQAEEMLRKLMEDEKKLREAEDSKLEFTGDGANYVLRITLRGFRTEDFSVTVEDGGRLSVRSKLPAAAGPGFVKEFQLPSDSDTSPVGIRASFNDIDGVLTLTVPKGVWIENATNYVLCINLQGFRKDDLTLMMDDADNKISVLAQGPTDGGPRFFKEYPLPSKAILNDIRADFEAGVLTITAPKRTAAPAHTTMEETRKPKAGEQGGAADDPFDSDEEGNWIENATNYVLRIKLEGISKEDVRVQGNGEGGVTVRGNFPDNGPCLFNQSFVLPSTASLAGMGASFSNSILTVTVPKRTVARLSPTAVVIRRPKAKEDQAWSRTREQQVDCAKPLPTKDDGEIPKKEDVFKKALDKATGKAQREEKDEKEEPANRSKQDVVMRNKEETKPIVPEEAVPRPPKDAINEKAKIIDQKSQVERLRRYCCCFGGRGSGLKENENISV